MARRLLSKQRVPIYVVIVVAFLLCLSVPTLALAAYAVASLPRLLPTSILLPAQAATVPPTSTVTITPSPLPPTATATPSPVCGGPRAMFILLIGSDSRANSYAAGLADSIRVARVDFVDPGITHLAFPRDLYVEIPGLSAHAGVTHGKLNQAYLYGNPAYGYFSGPGEGPGLLARTMRENLGTQADHYIALHLQSFVRVIDQLGGLDIDLPYTVDGRVTRSLDPDRYFPAGRLHLDGYRTMLLARLRPNGDLQRSVVQNLILQALAAKILTPATLPKIPALVDALYGSVQTDLGPSEIGQLLCLAAKLDSSKIQGRTFPEGILTGTRVRDPILGYTFIWQADFNLLRQYVASFNEGSWPAAPIPTPVPTNATP